MTNEIKALPSVRRHTFHFLEQAREVQPVFLCMDVDASVMKKSRKHYKQYNISISYISYIILAISKAIENFPEVNTSVVGRWSPKQISYNQICAKFTIDKQVDNQRIVVSSVIPNANKESIHKIQEYIDQMKKISFQEEKSFEPVRKLQSLPVWLGRLIYKRILKKSDKRLKTQGSFTVTSLGHIPVQQFFPITSNTTCFGVGAIMDKAIIENGSIVIKPMMPLSMTFDHRAIDGAVAAEFLHKVKLTLENWGDQPWQEDQKKPSMMSS